MRGKRAGARTTISSRLELSKRILTELSPLCIGPRVLSACCKCDGDADDLGPDQVLQPLEDLLATGITTACF